MFKDMEIPVTLWLLQIISMYQMITLYPIDTAVPTFYLKVFRQEIVRGKGGNSEEGCVNVERDGKKGDPPPGFWLDPPQLLLAMVRTSRNMQMLIMGHPRALEADEFWSPGPSGALALNGELWARPGASREHQMGELKAVKSQEGRLRKNEARPDSKQENATVLVFPNPSSEVLFTLLPLWDGV